MGIRNVLARHLTLAAEITGRHELTVDVVEEADGYTFARCHGCQAAESKWPTCKTWAAEHAASCRALPGSGGA
ncbi:hypothetical protein [Streptomyces odontomachi]|uniref:hypothetical protein n=1 Tax=Streptomyces odontomachi TaxID=2944940 RepID=UPI00210F076B|nr:hypothetical protein [Streptomyces sp. ODS25]